MKEYGLKDNFRKRGGSRKTIKKNMLGKSIKICSKKPMTGFYRDGYCMTGPADKGTHSVCATMNRDFLDYTANKGNDLSSVVKPGDKWCLCEYRWQEAFKDGNAPKVDMKATNMRTKQSIRKQIKTQSIKRTKTAYFSGGCFWGLESKFKKLNGVLDTDVGFMGSKKKATYKEVSSGHTGHAETIKIVYNNTIISFNTLVDKFFIFHDPTTLNKQGNDIGKQYRSIAFYSNKKEKKIIDSYIQKSPKSIVTEVKKTMPFYKADEIHQDYNEKDVLKKICKNNSTCVKFIKTKQQGGTQQFLFNPKDPKKSFDVYIDKNPKDTIPIKYTTLKDVKDTIKKLERLYKQGKYPHKRIWQVGMILYVRLKVLKDKKKEHYKLAKQYFKFLGQRTKLKSDKERKKFKFTI